ncbi:hypothetical protein GF322_04870 [Candidatus Dependentiae bacterium]|nr:hypothetical protein [Candidatus Dependentiae bacterium]
MILGRKRFMSIDFIHNIIPWITKVLFFGALLPQIFLNYKIKSANGLSDLYLIGYFSAYFLNVFYVFGLNFPFAYKIFAPLCLFAVIFIILQKVLYSNLLINIKVLKLYITDLLILLIFVPFIFFFPIKIGHLAGWVLILIWSLYQFPQIYKIYKNKSVQGFSFFLVTLIGLGNLFEFIVAILFDLPLQTFFISVRGIIIYIIYCLEFWSYKY